MEDKLESITPENMSRFSKAVGVAMKDMYHSHPTYPKISKKVFESFAKRLLGNWKRISEQEKINPV